MLAFFVLAFLFTSLEAANNKLISIPSPPYTKSQVGTYLSKGWAGYKMKFILTNGRVVRPEDGNDTVSEGQAYGMLFAVYMNDKKTFDKCFQWAEQNLSRQLPSSRAHGAPNNL